MKYWYCPTLADATAINLLLKKVLKTGLLILDHCVPADSNRSMWLVLLRQASIPGKEQPLWLRLSSITWPNLSKIFNCSWLIKAMDDWKLDAAHWRNESTFVKISIVELHIQILSTYVLSFYLTKSCFRILILHLEF